MIIKEKTKELFYKNALKERNRNKSILSRSLDEIQINSIQGKFDIMDTVSKLKFKSTRFQTLMNNLKQRLQNARANKDIDLENQLIKEYNYIQECYGN